MSNNCLQYPNANHPLNTSKHFCSICEDRASGKHYGVYSCEGCKGFFKRTVRKDLSYACREDKNCIIDKRQRNRCQYCRYQKCLSQGMKREAVQEERQRNKEKNENEVESTSNSQNEMLIERIRDAEIMTEVKAELSPEKGMSSFQDSRNDVMQCVDGQVRLLVEWAKNIPHFSDLSLDDQITLLRVGWNELLIACLAHRSCTLKDGLLVANGLILNRTSVSSTGLGAIYDRLQIEMLPKMHEMRIDKTEMGCLRCIILFNPEAKGIKNHGQVELLREKIYTALEDYCKQNYPDQSGRFAKLLLRLPTLRSIALKCPDHLFLKLSPHTSIDSLILTILDSINDI